MEIEVKVDDIWRKVTIEELRILRSMGKISRGSLIKIDGKSGLAEFILDSDIMTEETNQGEMNQTSSISSDKQEEPRLSIAEMESGDIKKEPVEKTASSSFFDSKVVLNEESDFTGSRPYQIRAIDYQQFIHPTDKAALAALEIIPGLPILTKKYLQYFNEKLLNGINMASKLRLSKQQLPEIYDLLDQTCQTLGIRTPELYLELNPVPNAYTYGDTKPFIVLTSGLVDLFPTEELKTVIAHECGHILCHHVLYNTLVNSISLLGSSLISYITKPLELGLMYWSRRSEFSADRVAAYVMNDDIPVIRTILRQTAGSTKYMDRIDINEYIRQGKEYVQMLEDSTYDNFLQTYAIMDNRHPLGVVRCYEIQSWFQSNKNRLPKPACNLAH